LPPFLRHLHLLWVREKSEIRDDYVPSFMLDAKDFSVIAARLASHHL
jgi:hypothetical protein